MEVAPAPVVAPGDRRITEMRRRVVVAVRHIDAGGPRGGKVEFYFEDEGPRNYHQRMGARRWLEMEEASGKAPVYRLDLSEQEMMIIEAALIALEAGMRVTRHIPPHGDAAAKLDMTTRLSKKLEGTRRDDQVGGA